MKHTVPYSRTRSDCSVIPRFWYVHSTEHIRKNASTLTSNVNYSVQLPGGYNGGVMHDVVTPGYSAIIANGGIVNNPMSRDDRWTTIDETINGMISMWETNKSGLPNGATLSSTLSAIDQIIIPDNASSFFPSIPLDTVAILATLQQQAVNASVANAHQRNVMGMVDLAEGKKTLDMLRTQAGRVEKILHGMPVTGKYVRSKSKRASRSRLFRYVGRSPLGRAADVAGVWLEINYGLIPLMLSIEGLVKSLGTMQLEAARLTFRGSDSWNQEKESTKYTDGSANGVSLTHTGTIRQSVQAHARAGVLTTYSPNLKAMLGLEGRDVIPGVYELIPYSFVADWFWDLGTYLEAVTPVSGYSQLASWVTVFLEENITYKYHRNGGQSAWVNNQRWTYGEYSSSVSTRRYYKARSVNVPVGIPNIRTDLKSLTHLVSGAALVLSNTLNSRAFRKHLTR